MKKRYLVIIFLIVGLSLHGQVSQNPLPDYLRHFQYQKALDYMEMQEQTKDIQIQKALCYKALGNHKQALEILYPLSQDNDNDLQVLTEMAFCYEALSQRQQSVDCYDKLIALDSANVYFKMQKADLLYQMGKYSQSLDIFKYIDEEYHIPNSLKRIGQCFEKLNIPDSAMIYFKEAWNQNPNDSYSAANLINLCLKNKRIPEAVAYSDTYIGTDSTDNQINLLNALAYYIMDNYEEAIARFSKCYERGDSSLVVNRSLGIAYYSMNDSDKAQPFLESAFRQDSTNNNVLYCLAVASNDMGEHEKSIPLFEKLLERTIPPDLTLYLYYRNLASAYDKGRQYQKSADTYIQALEYGGDNQRMNVYYLLGNLFEERLNNKAKALEYFGYYKKSLAQYYENLESKKDIEAHELADIRFKIRHLDSHISKLEKEVKPELQSQTIAKSDSLLAIPQ